MHQLCSTAFMSCARQLETEHKGPFFCPKRQLFLTPERTGTSDSSRARMLRLVPCRGALAEESAGGGGPSQAGRAAARHPRAAWRQLQPLRSSAGGLGGFPASFEAQLHPTAEGARGEEEAPRERGGSSAGAGGGQAGGWQR